MLHTLKLVEFIDLKSPGIVLDLGCGTGFSTETLKELGFKVFGIDINPYMLRFAKKKNLYLILGDFKNIKHYFKKDVFDAIISVSALQWIKESRDMKKISEGMYYVLKDKRMVGIQFYPASSEELYTWIRIFKKLFEVKLVIENENSPRKRNIYLILKKL